MKLKSLTLKNFRKISNEAEPTITFNPDINVLVGANNAGKTSILNAIQMLFLDQNYNQLQKFNPISNTNYLIQDGTLEIEGIFQLTLTEWHSLTDILLQNAGYRGGTKNQIVRETLKGNTKPFILSLSESEFSWVKTFSLINKRVATTTNKAAFPTELYKSLLGEYDQILPQLAELVTRTNFYSVYRTPLYLDSKGLIEDSEQFKPLNQLSGVNIDLRNNQTNIRGQLYALKKKEFKSKLLEIFEEIEDIDVIHNEDVGQFQLVIKEKLRRNGELEEVTYDINNVGQGMQTLVIMLSTVLLLRPSIVLMDEPEVHMHPSLIKQFVEYIKKLTPEIQFIITTHSVVLINEVGLDKVFSLKNDVNRKGIIVTKVDDKNSLLETISQLGYNVDTLTYTLKPKVYVFAEGPSDKDILLAFAQKSDTQKSINSNNVAFIEMGGKGNRYKLVNLINKLQQDFMDTPFLMLLDRDETSEEEVEKLRQRYFAGKPARLQYLSKRQIENYLIDEEALQSVVSKKLRDESLIKSLKEVSINGVLLTLAEQQKDKIFDNFLKELFINESVLGTAEIRDLLNEIKDKPLNDAKSDFIRKIGGEMAVKASNISQKTISSQDEFNQKWESNKLEMVDGRELLKSFRKWVQEEYRVSFTHQELIDEISEIHPDLQTVIKLIAEPELL
jgi:predicted ATP-dependent endonuclease of OLD family